MSDTPPFRIVGDLATDTLWLLEGRMNGGTPYEEAVLKLTHGGKLYLDAECRVGGDWKTAEEWYGLTLTWSVMSGPGELDVAALRAELEPGGELHDLMAVLATGHDVDWEGTNLVGVLDADAQEALDSICDHFAETRYATTEETMDASEWISPSPIDGLDADTSDEQLVTLAEELEQDARSDRVFIVGALDELRRRRDDLQYEREADG
jgi:hypothetical protein